MRKKEKPATQNARRTWKISIINLLYSFSSSDIFIFSSLYFVFLSLPRQCRKCLNFWLFYVMLDANQSSRPTCEKRRHRGTKIVDQEKEPRAFINGKRLKRRNIIRSQALWVSVAIVKRNEKSLRWWPRSWWKLLGSKELEFIDFLVSLRS